MFSWWARKKVVAQGALIGDLDLMSRRPVFIRLKDRKEYEVKDLTAREYARAVAIIQEIDTETKAAKDPDRVQELYEEFFSITMPTLSSRKLRKLPLVDVSAMYIWIVKYYGGDVEKKKTGQLALKDSNNQPISSSM